MRRDNETEYERTIRNFKAEGWETLYSASRKYSMAMVTAMDINNLAKTHQDYYLSRIFISDEDVVVLALRKSRLFSQ
jgi:Holliday junction resolvase RusA-like endonuclease